MLPTAAIVSQVVAVVLLAGIAFALVRVYREREPSSPPVGPLERAQEIAILMATVGLAVRTFVDSGIVDAVWVVGVFAALALTLVRRQRGEPMLPRWL